MRYPYIQVLNFPPLFETWLDQQLNSNNNTAEGSMQLSQQDPAKIILYHFSGIDCIDKFRDPGDAYLLAWWNGPDCDESGIFKLLNKGICGILDRHSTIDDIRQAVSDIIEKGIHLNNIVNSALLHYCRKQGVIGKTHNLKTVTFCAREKNAIEYRQNGLTSRQIAEKLFLSKKSIDKLFGDLYRRFECNNFFELLKLYEEHNLNPAIETMRLLDRGEILSDKKAHTKRYSQNFPV